MRHSGTTSTRVEGGKTTERRGRSGWVGLCVLLMVLTATLLAPGVALGVPSTGAMPQGVLAPVNPAFLEAVAGGVPLGYLPSPVDFSRTAGAQVDVPRYGAFPTSYDLRTLGKLTAIRDQSPLSTCWAFATMASLESCLLTGQTWDFSEDNLALTAGFDDDDPASPGEDPYSQGNLMMGTAYLARWSGPVLETADPYGDGVAPGGLAVQKHVQNVDWLWPRASATDNDDIKQALQDHGAVGAAMHFTTNPLYWKDTTDSYYYYSSAESNHAVTIVGWDDNYAASNFQGTPAGNGAFIVRNSYGATWGASGYFYVSYYDTALGRDDILAVFNGGESTGNYSRIYQYDPLGFCSQFGWLDKYGNPSTTAWFSNKFTAAAAGDLTAVSFFTPVPNATYQVYVNAGANFVYDYSYGGTDYYTLSAKTLRTSGTIADMGYHTVTLPSPVGVTNGQRFVVAVKLTTPGDEYPIVLEKPLATYSSAATASTGQSYSSPDGTTWMDMAAEYPNTNVCLKAFAGPVPPPTITSVEPDVSSTAGGKRVVITGTNFVGLTGADAVTFGGTNANSYTVNSPTQITAYSPAHAEGTFRVRVKTPTGTTDNPAVDDFTYLPPATYTSYRGTDRYFTALLLSQAAFPAALPAGSGVVVAPGTTFPEALCGAPLAAAYGGPVLLTPTTGLHNDVKAELQRLQPDYVFVIGLSTTIRNNVQTALPGATVTPIGGSTIYHMSHNVALALGARVNATGGDISDAVGLVTIGGKFVDALGLGPLACAQKWPIILTDGTASGPLHAEAVATFTDLGMTQMLKVGTYSGPPAGVTSLANLSGVAPAGQSHLARYYTNANIANWALANTGLTFAHSACATGDKFPDALASGPFLATDLGILAVSPLNGPVPDVIKTLITANRADVDEFTFIACIEPVIGTVKALLP